MHHTVIAFVQECNLLHDTAQIGMADAPPDCMNEFRMTQIV